MFKKGTKYSNVCTINSESSYGLPMKYFIEIHEVIICTIIKYE